MNLIERDAVFYVPSYDWKEQISFLIIAHKLISIQNTQEDIRNTTELKPLGTVYPIYIGS